MTAIVTVPQLTEYQTLNDILNKKILIRLSNKFEF